MKKYLVFAAAAAMFAACSENDVTQEKNVVQQPAEQQALSFEAYTQRGLTRSGWVGSLNQTQLQALATAGGGFGVFAYYTDNNQYDAQATPNFMYNQLVEYKSTKWEYSPIKYWPNEYGNSAISDDQDKVSFFAYAPFVEVVAPATGKVADATSGIVGVSRNTSAGDPIVKYISTFDVDKAVDLCWGVVGKDATAWNTIQSDYTQEMTAGKPWIDVLRPGLSGVTTPDQKLKFTFLHALAKLNVTIDIAADDIVAKDVIEGAVADDPSTTEDESKAAKTKVYVRSISFSGFAQKGALNLNNETAFTPRWVDFSGTDDLTADDEIIIYDGRKDGKEGMASAIANNEKVLGLNPNIISNDLNTTPGVTGTTVNLFRKWNKTGGEDGKGAYEGATTEPIYIIPTGEEVSVTIVYDIETVDGNLPTMLSDGKTYGSSVENRISKKISFGTAGAAKMFEAGKAYTIALHLGLNSVKFDADIKDWEDATNIDVDLPSNLPVYAAVENFEATGASATAKTADLTLPAETTTYKFAVSGLNAGESTSSAYDAASSDGVQGKVTKVTNTTDGDKYDVKSNGIAIEEATIEPNMYTSNKPGTIKVWGLASSKGIYINVTKQAHALGLMFDVTKATSSFTLHSGGWNAAATPSATYFDNVIWADQVDDGEGTTDHTFIVKKNGTKLNYAASTPSNNEYSYTAGTDNKTATITLGEPASVGDVFTVTIQAGDAEVETYSYTVKE